MIFPLETDDDTGFKVSLSRDGQTLAISSPDGGPVGNGVVNVYYKGMDKEEYRRIGRGIMGEESDMFGYSLCVSRNGKIVSSGSPDAQYVSTFVIGAGNELSHLSPNSLPA